jgi:hypothetical protein
VGRGAGRVRVVAGAPCASDSVGARARSAIRRSTRESALRVNGRSARRVTSALVQKEV